MGEYTEVKEGGKVFLAGGGIKTGKKPQRAEIFRKHLKWMAVKKNRLRRGSSQAGFDSKGEERSIRKKKKGRERFERPKNDRWVDTTVPNTWKKARR